MSKIYYQIQFLEESEKEYSINNTTTNWDEAISIRDDLIGCDNIQAVKIVLIEELDKVIKEKSKYA